MANGAKLSCSASFERVVWDFPPWSLFMTLSCYTNGRAGNKNSRETAARFQTGGPGERETVRSQTADGIQTRAAGSCLRQASQQAAAHGRLTVAEIWGPCRVSSPSPPSPPVSFGPDVRLAMKRGPVRMVCIASRWEHGHNRASVYIVVLNSPTSDQRKALWTRPLSISTFVTRGGRGGNCDLRRAYLAGDARYSLANKSHSTLGCHTPAVLYSFFRPSWPDKGS